MNQEGRWVEGSFTTLEKSFKYTVMFFGLTNFPTTFQIMMYNVIRQKCGQTLRLELE